MTISTEIYDILRRAHLEERCLFDGEINAIQKDNFLNEGQKAVVVNAFSDCRIDIDDVSRLQAIGFNVDAFLTPGTLKEKAAAALKFLRNDIRYCGAIWNGVVSSGPELERAWIALCNRDAEGASGFLELGVEALQASGILVSALSEEGPVGDIAEIALHQFSETATDELLGEFIEALNSDEDGAVRVNRMLSIVGGMGADARSFIPFLLVAALRSDTETSIRAKHALRSVLKDAPLLAWDVMEAYDKIFGDSFEPADLYSESLIIPFPLLIDIFRDIKGIDIAVWYNMMLLCDRPYVAEGYTIRPEVRAPDQLQEMLWQIAAIQKRDPEYVSTLKDVIKFVGLTARQYNKYGPDWPRDFAKPLMQIIDDIGQDNKDLWRMMFENEAFFQSAVRRLTGKDMLDKENKTVLNDFIREAVQKRDSNFFTALDAYLAESGIQVERLKILFQSGTREDRLFILSVALSLTFADKEELFRFMFDVSGPEVRGKVFEAVADKLSNFSPPSGVALFEKAMNDLDPGVHKKAEERLPLFMWIMPVDKLVSFITKAGSVSMLEDAVNRVPTNNLSGFLQQMLQKGSRKQQEVIVRGLATSKEFSIEEPLLRELRRFLGDEEVAVFAKMAILRGKGDLATDCFLSVISSDKSPIARRVALDGLDNIGVDKLRGWNTNKRIVLQLQAAYKSETNPHVQEKIAMLVKLISPSSDFQRM